MATIDSIETLVNTAHLLKDTFGTSEFTKKDYDERIHNSNEETFAFSTIRANYAHTCMYSAFDKDWDLIKRSRIEEFILHDEDGEAFVGKRYYYTVNPNIDEVVENNKEMLVKQSKEAMRLLRKSIYEHEQKIAIAYKNINKWKKFLAENKKED